MEPERGDDVRSETPYMDYIETAEIVPLPYVKRTPDIPAPDEPAPPWEVSDWLATSQVFRTLRQTHYFRDLGQDLGLSCYRYFQNVSPEFMIDWKAGESRNIRLPAHGIPGPIQEQVDDLWSFRKAIYRSVIVTAMEMARLLYGGPYHGSYRYSRDSAVNLVRGARWDILPYNRTESATTPHGTQVSCESKGSEGPSMVVICIPPWDLSKFDLQEFADRKTLDLVAGKMKTLWTIVYEACKEACCSYFTVTTYDYWVFGNMSKNRTTASVSPVFDFSERSAMYQRPSLLQLLTYWELASIGAASWDIPLDQDVVNRGWY